MENTVTISEDQRIPIIQLVDKVEKDPEFSMNKAYKTAVKELGFKGNIGDFMDMLKENNLIESEQEKKRQAKKLKMQKAIKYSAIGGAVILGVVFLNKVLTSKN